MFVLIAVQSTTVNAALYDRGYGFIYDDVLDVTWYDFTYQSTDWYEANTWAESLVMTYPVTGNTFTEWRLPYTWDIPYGAPYVLGYSGIWGEGVDGISHNWGYNLSSSELGILFYESLGNLALYDPNGYLQDSSLVGLQNTGPFTNLFNDFYWSATDYANYPLDAWLFNFSNGCQKKFMKGGIINAIALHDGDISLLNRAPMLQAIGNQVIPVGSLFELIIDASDPDSGQSPGTNFANKDIKHLIVHAIGTTRSNLINFEK